MSKRMKRILFLVCLLLFIVVVPLAVVYSQGYKVDFVNGGFKISKTGGLFIKASPKQADVYLNNPNSAHKIESKKTDFFFGSLLIENLFPKTYKIEVAKEGYISWQKNLEIKEKEVTEAKNIILFPKDPGLTVFSRELENFWLSPDQKKIILREKNNNKWSLNLYEIDKEVKSHLIDEDDISIKGAELLSLEFSQDSKTISLETGLEENIKYFTINLEKSPVAPIKAKAPITSTTTLASIKINGDSYYLDRNGNIFKNMTKLNSSRFPVQQETDYSLEIFGDYIFLKENQNLYLFNQESKKMELFSQNINIIKASPSQKVLALSSDNEMQLFFLKDNETFPKKKAGERMTLIRLSEKIKDFFWLNDDYLLFNTGNEVKIIETDDRDKAQVWNLASSADPVISFSQQDKRLYLLSENKLYRSDALLP
jgi:hypothetical protein